MKKTLIGFAVAAFTILCFVLAVPAATQATRPAVKYVPVGVFYVDGHLVDVMAFPKDVFDSLKECSEVSQRSILDMKTKGEIPPNGDLAVACLPVPVSPPGGASPSAPDVKQPPVKGIGRADVSNL